MSALEQIRKRPGLIISILGLALVLFIFTAISNPEKLFSDPSTIVKVNGEKIDYTQFQKRQEELRRQYELRGMKNVDNAMLQEQAIQSLIEENLMDNEMKRLGITVTGEELSKAMLGDNIPMAVQQLYWQRQQQGLYSGRDLYEAAFNPMNYGISAEDAQVLKEQWMDLEQQVAQMLKQQKFQTLVLGTLVANDLDARSQYDDNNNSTNVRMVRVDASTISDSDVEVSDADIKAQYNDDKEMYALDEDTYVVNYIVAEVTPSDEDRLEATQAVEGALAGLREQQGTNALNGNNKFVINRINTAAKYLPSNLADKLEALQQDSVIQVSFYDNKYTLAKYMGTESATDSITFDMIALAETANADSIINLLNNGTTLGDLAEGTVAQSQLGQRASMLNSNAQIGLVFGAAEEGNYFNAPDMVGSPNIIFRLAHKDAPVVKYSIAEVTYQLEPSATTINDTQARLRAYVENNPDAKAFAENATAANFTSLQDKVTNQSLSVGNVPDSRGLAKWAVKAKKGQVSEVYSADDKSAFIAGALADKYDKGYTPLRDTQVDAQSRAKAVRAKKIAKLQEQYDGKATSLEGYAQAMNARIDTTTVTFGQNYARGVMPGDSKFIAAASEAEAGKLTGPMGTEYSVIVFEVIDREAPSREFDAVNDATYFQQNMGAQALLRNFPQILRAKADVDNRVQKFYQD